MTVDVESRRTDSRKFYKIFLRTLKSVKVLHFYTTYYPWRMTNSRISQSLDLVRVVLHKFSLDSYHKMQDPEVNCRFTELTKPFHLQSSRENKVQGLVVQSIDSLTSSLRGQLGKCFMATQKETTSQTD